MCTYSHPHNYATLDAHILTYCFFYLQIKHKNVDKISERNSRWLPVCVGLCLFAVFASLLTLPWPFWPVTPAETV